MTKQETLPKGVGVAKFDFPKHFVISYFHVLGYTVVYTYLKKQISSKVLKTPNS